jgi:hypothetical protein
MKKIIHKLRERPEEERRHLLHIITFLAAVIMIILWIWSLGRSVTNPDTKIKMQQDLQPFSNFGNNITGNTNQ